MGRLVQHASALEPTGYVPPAEYEAAYYEHLNGRATIDDGAARGILQPAPSDDRHVEGIL